MAPHTHDENGQVTDDSHYVSSDSGYGTHTSIVEEDRGLEEESGTVAGSNRERINLTLAASNAARDRRIRGRRAVLYGQRISSRIPTATTRTTRCSTPNVCNTPYGDMLQDVHHALNRPSVNLNQQRLLRTLMSTLLSLRLTARHLLPGLVQGLVSLRASPPVYGPHPRPLSEAAIRQNARARTRVAYISALEAAGHQFPHRPVYTARPIRYNDACDDLLGTRSLEDGTAAASAERDGDAFTYAIRFSRHLHNGLKLKKGHLHITTEDRHLVELRQARKLAGLPTEEVDEEITYRVLRDLDGWGWLGGCIRQSEWSTRRPTCYCGSVSCRNPREPRLDI